MTGWGNVTERARMKRRHSSERARWAAELAAAKRRADDAEATLAVVQGQCGYYAEKWVSVQLAAARRRTELNNQAADLAALARIRKVLGS